MRFLLGCVFLNIAIFSPLQNSFDKQHPYAIYRHKILIQAKKSPLDTFLNGITQPFEGCSSFNTTYIYILMFIYPCTNRLRSSPPSTSCSYYTMKY